MPGRKRRVEEDEDEEIIERAPNGDLSEVMKWNIVAFSNKFRYPETKRFRPGTVPPILQRFGIAVQTLTRLMAEYDEKMATGIQFVSLKPQKIGKVGILSKLADDIIENIIDIHNWRSSIYLFSPFYFSLFKSIPYCANIYNKG